MARIKDKYLKEIVPQMMKDFNYKNIMKVPRLEKILVSMCSGETLQDIKILDKMMAELAIITGQKPKITRAKKAIAAFKLRKGIPIGCVTTLRGKRMYEFFDRLVNVALPRVKDFKGLPLKAFDGRGNYTLGIKEQIIFPEIDYDKVDKARGMNIVIVTSAKNNNEAKFLLKYLGVPFRE